MTRGLAPAAIAAVLSASSPACVAGSSNYQALWWRSPAGSESGWGLNIAHQGDTIFATWFTYDSDGSPLWLVMPEGMRLGESATYSGRLYQTTGPSLDASPWSALQVVATAVGDLVLTFTDADNGTMTYTINGVGVSANGDVLGGHGSTQTKPITRQVYASPAADCIAGARVGDQPNYQDLWWGAADGSQSGWGINIAHQGDVLFATWFTYGADRRGAWYVMSNGVKTGAGIYTGNLYRTRGPAFNAKQWDPAQVVATRVGSATFTFTTAESGLFAFTLDGVSRTLPLTRQVFASPPTVCR